MPTAFKGSRQSWEKLVFLFFPVFSFILNCHITYIYIYNPNANIYHTNPHLYHISNIPSSNIQQVHHLTSNKSTIPTSPTSPQFQQFQHQTSPQVHKTSSQVQHQTKELTTAATRCPYGHLHLKKATKSTRTGLAGAARRGPPNRSGGVGYAEEGSSSRRPRIAEAEEFRHPEARST